MYNMIKYAHTVSQFASMVVSSFIFSSYFCSSTKMSWGQVLEFMVTGDPEKVSAPFYAINLPFLSFFSA